MYNHNRYVDIRVELELQYQIFDYLHSPITTRHMVLRRCAVVGIREYSYILYMHAIILYIYCCVTSWTNILHSYIYMQLTYGRCTITTCMYTYVSMWNYNTKCWNIDIHQSQLIIYGCVDVGAIWCYILWGHITFSRSKNDNRWNGVQIILRTPKRVQNTYNDISSNSNTFTYMWYLYLTGLARGGIGCFMTKRYVRTYIYIWILIYIWYTYAIILYI